MINAVISLICITLLMGFMARSGGIKTDLSIVVVGCLIDSIFCFLIVGLVEYLRVTPKVTNHEKNTDQLNVWGYVWRTYVALILSKLLSFLLISSITEVNFPSVKALLTAAIIQPVFIILIAWLLYSNSRIEQLKLLFKAR